MSAMNIERVTADTVLTDSDMVFNSIEHGVWGRMRTPNAALMIVHPDLDQNALHFGTRDQRALAAEQTFYVVRGVKQFVRVASALARGPETFTGSSIADLLDEFKFHTSDSWCEACREMGPCDRQGDLLELAVSVTVDNGNLP